VLTDPRESSLPRTTSWFLALSGSPIELVEVFGQSRVEKQVIYSATTRLEVVVANLWEQVRALKGQTLQTVEEGVPFDIESIDDRKVKILVSSGKTYSIYRQEFDRAEALGLATADVRPFQLRKAGASEGNPAYVAAIIRSVIRADPTM
jgi:hypothetical protein